MPSYFKPDRAESLGLITNYRCTFRCRHCLYCSSPLIQENPDEDVLHRLIDQIVQVLGRVPVHIGGGEPLLHFDLIKRLIGRMNRSRLFLEYVETNGSPLVQETERKILELKAAGLPCLLISISPFHNEFISMNILGRVIREVIRGLGPEGLFPWHPGYLPFLEKAGTEDHVPLKKYWECFSPPEIVRQLTSIMYIHPGGRGAVLLARHLGRKPAGELFRSPCVQNLASPVHAHIDYQGNYLTGFCSGLRLGERTALSLPSLFKEGIELSRYPVLEMLLQGGVKALYDYALSQGYQPDETGYGSSCHLCLDLRVFLYGQGYRFPEFYPDFLYQELELMDSQKVHQQPERD